MATRIRSMQPAGLEPKVPLPQSLGPLRRRLPVRLELLDPSL